MDCDDSDDWDYDEPDFGDDGEKATVGWIFGIVLVTLAIGLFWKILQ